MVLTLREVYAHIKRCTHERNGINEKKSRIKIVIPVSDNLYYILHHITDYYPDKSFYFYRNLSEKEKKVIIKLRYEVFSHHMSEQEVILNAIFMLKYDEYMNAGLNKIMLIDGMKCYIKEWSAIRKAEDCATIYTIILQKVLL